MKDVAALAHDVAGWVRALATHPLFGIHELLPATSGPS
jgi:hypothetical protein